MFIDQIETNRGNIKCMKKHADRLRNDLLYRHYFP